MSEEILPEVTIPKEQAVFWMDRFGQWHNESGRFQHKKIIDYFNRSIRKDQSGYYVEQIREQVREKVYFRYEDTPLFVVDAQIAHPVELLLNTKESLFLTPSHLFIEQDNLYIVRDGERIKFTDRVLLKLSSLIEYEDRKYFFKSDGVRCLIREKPSSA